VIAETSKVAFLVINDEARTMKDIESKAEGMG
jgi:hypothetical protein